MDVGGTSPSPLGQGGLGSLLNKAFAPPQPAAKGGAPAIASANASAETNDAPPKGLFGRGHFVDIVI